MRLGDSEGEVALRPGLTAIFTLNARYLVVIIRGRLLDLPLTLIAAYDRRWRRPYTGTQSPI